MLSKWKRSSLLYLYRRALMPWREILMQGTFGNPQFAARGLGPVWRNRQQTGRPASHAPWPSRRTRRYSSSSEDGENREPRSFGNAREGVRPHGARHTSGTSLRNTEFGYVIVFCA